MRTNFNHYSTPLNMFYLLERFCLIIFLLLFCCSFFIFFLSPGFTSFLFFTRRHASLSLFVSVCFLSVRWSSLFVGDSSFPFCSPFIIFIPFRTHFSFCFSSS